MLGFYISGHPLDRFRELVEMLALEANTTNLAEHSATAGAAGLRGDEAWTCACPAESGKEWCRLSVEDFHGTAERPGVRGRVGCEHRDILFAEDRPCCDRGPRIRKLA